MSIVCDLSVIRGNTLDNLNAIQEPLVIPKVAINEVLSNSEWRSENFSRLQSTLRKILQIGDTDRLMILQPEDIILTWSGITSLPPLPSQTYLQKLVNELIASPINAKAVDLAVKNYLGNQSIESQFPEAIQVFTNQIFNSDLTESSNKRLMYHQLPANQKAVLRQGVKEYWTLSVKAYVTHVHDINPTFLMSTQLILTDIVLDVYAAYIYLRFGQRPAINDQYDLQYSFNLGESDKIWTSDRLILHIIENHLNRSTLLYR